MKNTPAQPSLATRVAGFLGGFKDTLLGKQPTVGEDNLIIPEEARAMIERRVRVVGEGTPTPGTPESALAKRLDAQIRAVVARANPGRSLEPKASE